MAAPPPPGDLLREGACSSPAALHLAWNPLARVVAYQLTGDGVHCPVQKRAHGVGADGQRCAQVEHITQCLEVIATDMCVPPFMEA
eukprot:988304-Rhodomonas_salina.1